jgi:hypothetical protein
MEYKLDDYTLKYYFKPGLNLTKEENIKLFNNLKKFNEKTYNFKYGLFEPSISLEKVLKLFESFILCVIYLKDELVGFYYFVILNETYKRPLIQLGLVVISKNKGLDIFSISEKIGLLFTYKKIGLYNSAIITTIPKIVEEFCLTYSNTWPNPKKNLSRPPVEYKSYLSDVEDFYIKPFFPLPFKINKKRFTLILDKREAGFHDRFHYLPMAKSFLFNSFCHDWINYNENEDLILIGKFNYLAIFRTSIFLLKNIFKIIFFNMVKK